MIQFCPAISVRLLKGQQKVSVVKIQTREGVGQVYMYASKINMINMTNLTTKHSPKCPLMVSLIRTPYTNQHNTLPMILGTFKISSWNEFAQ